MSQSAAALRFNKALSRYEHVRLARRGLTTTVGASCVVAVVIAFQRWGLLAGFAGVFCAPVVTWLVTRACSRPLEYLLCGRDVLRMAREVDD